LGDHEADIDISDGNDRTFDDKDELADEGLTQLLTDDQISKTKDLFDFAKLKDGSYTLKVKASANGNEKAYLKAWIDFNNNGQFDDGEASALTEVTTAGDYTLTFGPTAVSYDKTLDKLGVRLRIALNAGDIEKPTGTAFSGEVEDLQILRPLPPQGERKETVGGIGQRQETTIFFTAQGADQKDYDRAAVIDESSQPLVLDDAGHSLQKDAQGWYERSEGRYQVTADGANVKVAFEPKADFTGQAAGISIRRSDSNGLTTDWQSADNVNDQLHNMDGRFVPTVLETSHYTSSGIQGLEQVQELVFNDGSENNIPTNPDAGRPAQFLDAAGEPLDSNTVAATSNGQTVGTYELDGASGRVTFKPNKDFVGLADAVTLQVLDTGNIRHRASYQPTVTAVRPVGTDAKSEGIQGAVQTGQLVFTEGDARIPIDTGKLPAFDNGSQTKTVAGVGTYTIDNNNLVTFQPDPSYSGKPAAETVTRVDINGTAASAAYQA
ncbi:GEVED domain-containing protein, partial [Streptococcus sp. DD11]|uniref:GEVED domain-containing protein n=1 Tax=Streptococcus sp. DD11 TaxID=1777879 RepID=UPI001F496E1E